MSAVCSMCVRLAGSLFSWMVYLSCGHPNAVIVETLVTLLTQCMHALIYK